jgi:hypothetical protein
MVFHPPLLYMGYVGFSVASPLPIAALIGGRLDAPWARWTRPWTTAAWAFLTIGIALGSWWAYYELGWGGWWFWDPVENASFMPWLVGTALIHSLAVTEKRGSFKSWTVLLAIMAFSLSLLGTFLVRSGVLVVRACLCHRSATGPVHSGLPGRGSRRSLTLYAWRAPKVGSVPVSRWCQGSRPCWATTCCWWWPPARFCWARCIRCCWTRSGWGRSRSARLTSTRVHAADGAHHLSDGHRAAGALERGELARPRAAPALGRRLSVVVAVATGWLPAASRRWPRWAS